MKKLIDNVVRVVLMVSVIGLYSCQEEYEDVEGNDQEQTIAAKSDIAGLIKQTSSQDGSFDNIVDGASCFAIQFPYTVNANGVEININSKSDLEKIENVFDATIEGNNILEIVFPITITFVDYSQITIENKGELVVRARECIEGGGDDDIECVDFVYPITLFTFVIDAQQGSEIQVETDSDMYRVFSELEDNRLVSFQYPITLTKHDGTEVVIENNADLIATLELEKNQCDGDDAFSEAELDEYLMACPLQVKQVIRNQMDNSEQYLEHLMVFREDGSVVFSTFTANEITGAWNTSMSNGAVNLSLEFENFTDFSSEWQVYKLEEELIKLYKDDGNKILLERRCDI
ncbi:MAG: hypothetical protein NXH90_06485 [Flavobacteriaceae bacterium]|nr:hypothetical protein [Flavobacteriaceae bacterium]